MKIEIGWEWVNQAREERRGRREDLGRGLGVGEEHGWVTE